MAWSKAKSRDRIKKALEGLPTVEVVDLVRDTDLTALPRSKAYRVDGVHVYVEVTNGRDLLESDEAESQRCHRRYLRFLHVYQRVADVVFRETDAVKVDFQNQRLHFILYKPYNNANARVIRAVAIANLLRGLLEEANELHEELADVQVSVGIEAGRSIAVTNGTKGDREPLFLGDPANRAAKLLGNRGILLGHAARVTFGKDVWLAQDPAALPLTQEQLDYCADKANLDLDVEDLLEEWEAELADMKLADFSFSRATPPLKNLDLDTLTPANSKRMETCSLFADIDGFTAFISAAIEAGDEELAVRGLHVIRKELRDVLFDFGGRKIRYIGDCVHGVLAEGTSHSTDEEETVTAGVLCAAAMRDAFGVVLEELAGLDSLGIAIGLDLGPTVVTRLGIKGRRDRCCIGRAVVEAERMQSACDGTETGIGESAYKAAPDAVRSLFGKRRIKRGLTYNLAVATLEGHEETKRSLVKMDIIEAPPLVLPRAHAAEL